MKYKNQAIDKPEPEVVVIPRAKGDIEINLVAVTDFSDFERVSPDPKVPVKVYPGGRQVPDPDNTDYQSALVKNGVRRNVWMMVQSIIKGTPDISFEQVNGDPETWTFENFEKEFYDAGFTRAEFAAISQAAMRACGLSMEKVEEATKTFLARKAAAANV